MRCRSLFLLCSRGVARSDDGGEGDNTGALKSKMIQIPPLKQRPLEEALSHYRHDDPSALSVESQLLRARTSVEYGQRVSAALRERSTDGTTSTTPFSSPQLLPVTEAALLRNFELGLRNGTASLALEISKRLTLRPGRAARPGRREALDRSIALSLGQCDRWEEALEVVRRSRACRPQLKRAMQHYVECLGLWRRALQTASFHDAASSSAENRRPQATMTPEQLTEAVRCAPSWRHALAVLRQVPAATPAAVPAYLLREDTRREVVWTQRRDLLLHTVPPHHHTMEVAQSIVDDVPRSDPHYLLHACGVLREAVARLSGRNFARLWGQAVCAGRWAEAAALGVAGGYHDLVSSLAAQHPQCLAAYEWPEQQRLYDAECAALRGGTSAPRALLSPEQVAAYVLFSLSHERERELGKSETGDRSSDSGNDQGASAASASTSCPHARPLLSGEVIGAAMENPRLAALLEAHLREDDENGAAAAAAAAPLPLSKVEGEGRPLPLPCFLFAEAAFTRLVMRHTTPLQRQRFLRALPTALHDGLEDPHSSTTTTPKRSRESDASSVVALLDEEPVLRDSQGVQRMCMALLRFLEARRLYTEANFLRLLAQVLADGRVQLPPKDRYMLGLAVLEALGRRRRRVDALLSVRTAAVIPSPFLDTHPNALQSVITARNLLGNWSAALRIFARLERKQQEASSSATASASAPSRTPSLITKAVLLAALQSTFYMPDTTEARRHAHRLWHSYGHYAPAAVITDLLRGDNRQACEKLSTYRLRGDRRSTRALLGACFSLLSSEAALRQCVEAALGRDRVTAADLDAHGLQRLARALPWTDALHAMRSGGPDSVPDTHTLLTLMMLGSAVNARGTVTGGQSPAAEAPLPLEAVDAFASLRPTCTTLNSVRVCLHAVARRDLSAAVHAVAHYFQLTSRRQRLFSEALCDLLEHVLRLALDEAETASSVTAGDGVPDGRTAWQQQLFRLKGIYYGLRREEAFTVKLQTDRRRVLAHLLCSPCAGSPALLLGYLHRCLSHHTQRPVPAALTSRLLGVAAARTDDWLSALACYRQLHRPVAREARDLVVAVHRHPAAAQILLGVVRFARQCPQQVLLWCSVGDIGETDDAAERNPWKLALELLRDAGAGDEASGDQMTHPRVAALVRSWSAVECERALEVLRRLSNAPSASGAESFDAAFRPVTQLVLRRQSELQSVEKGLHPKE